MLASSTLFQYFITQKLTLNTLKRYICFILEIFE